MKITRKWALKKYFGLTEEEIILNEKMWRKMEKKEKMKRPASVHYRGLSEKQKNTKYYLESRDHLNNIAKYIERDRNRKGEIYCFLLCKKNLRKLKKI